MTQSAWKCCQAPAGQEGVAGWTLLGSTEAHGLLKNKIK